MQSLNSFKSELGVSELNFLQGKGRAFCNTKGICIVIGKTTDTAKPLYVIEMSKTAEGEVIPKGTAYVIVNNENVKEYVTL